jgi:hypothetical protein
MVTLKLYFHLIFKVKQYAMEALGERGVRFLLILDLGTRWE